MEEEGWRVGGVEKMRGRKERDSSKRGVERWRMGGRNKWKDGRRNEGVCGVRIISINKKVSLIVVSVAIIGTHQEKSGMLFWNIISKLPLQDHPIVSWKFCHVLHKVLREGHTQVGIVINRWHHFDRGRSYEG